jgi:hypothetical protein
LGSSSLLSHYAALAGLLARSSFTKLARFGLLALTLALNPITVAFPSEINPALLYDQAMLIEPKFEPEDSQYVFGTDWRGRTLDERFGRIISKYDASFRLLGKAAQSQVRCDWGVDLSDGPKIVMPRLAPAKHLVQVARLRVRWYLQNKQQPKACDELLTALALGRNLSRDGLQISTLVQFSIEELFAWAVAENFGQYSPDTLRTLANGLEAAPARGTLAQSIPLTKSLFCDWYLSRISQFQREHPGNEAKVLELIRNELFRPTLVSEDERENDLPDRLIADGGRTVAGVAAQIRALGPLYKELERVLALPYAEYGPSFDQFRTGVQRLSNPLAQRLLNYDHSRQIEFGTAVELAMVRAAIAYRLDGEAGLNSVSDPCGIGPFKARRFLFEGADRGFELSSSHAWNGKEQVLIFVEKAGKPFVISGPNAGTPVLDQAENMRLRYGLPAAPAGQK